MRAHTNSHTHTHGKNMCTCGYTDSPMDATLNYKHTHKDVKCLDMPMIDPLDHSDLSYSIPTPTHSLLMPFTQIFSTPHTTTTHAHTHAKTATLNISCKSHAKRCTHQRDPNWFVTMTPVCGVPACLMASS